MMGKQSTFVSSREASRFARSALVLAALFTGALLFAAGPAVAEDPHQQTDSHHQTEQVAHEAQGHEAQDGHGQDAHGEDAHGEAMAHGEGDEHAGEHHGSTPHLKNLVAVIGEQLPHSTASKLEEFVDPIFAAVIIILLCVFFISVSRNLKARNPGRLQMLAELLVGGLYGLVRSIIGPTARRYVPFLGTLFIFIWLNNLFGMVPGMHAATSAFNTTTFALGIMTFFFVQFWAIRLNGIGGYLHHMAGSPKTALDWGFVVLMFPLHLLGELIKPISLGLRLFGNIFGEDTLVATMVILGYLIVKPLAGDAAAYLPGVPLQLPFYFLGLLSSTIQALVFTLLATVYIALWLPHDDHGHHEHGEEAHGH